MPAGVDRSITDRLELRLKICKWATTISAASRHDSRTPNLNLVLRPAALSRRRFPRARRSTLVHSHVAAVSAQTGTSCFTGDDWCSSARCPSRSRTKDLPGPTAPIDSPGATTISTCDDSGRSPWPLSWPSLSVGRVRGCGARVGGHRMFPVLRPHIAADRPLRGPGRSPLIDDADRRTASFYGSRLSNSPVLICSTASCYRRLGGGGKEPRDAVDRSRCRRPGSTRRSPATSCYMRIPSASPARTRQSTAVVRRKAGGARHRRCLLPATGLDRNRCNLPTSKRDWSCARTGILLRHAAPVGDVFRRETWSAGGLARMRSGRRHRPDRQAAVRGQLADAAVLVCIRSVRGLGTNSATQSIRTSSPACRRDSRVDASPADCGEPRTAAFGERWSRSDAQLGWLRRWVFASRWSQSVGLLYWSTCADAVCWPSSPGCLSPAAPKRPHRPGPRRRR